MSGKTGGRAGEDAATFGAVERLEAVDRMQQLKRLHQPRERDKPDGRHARFEEEKEPLSSSSPESPDVEDMHLALIQAYNNQLVLKADLLVPAGGVVRVCAGGMEGEVRPPSCRSVRVVGQQ